MQVYPVGITNEVEEDSKAEMEGLDHNTDLSIKMFSHAIPPRATPQPLID